MRCSVGLPGRSPLARASRFKISVKLTTPTSRPDNRALGSADAGVDGTNTGGNPPEAPGCGAKNGIGRCELTPELAKFVCEAEGDAGGDVAGLDPALFGTKWLAGRDGVGGPDEDGDMGSVTQSLYNAECRERAIFFTGIMVISDKCDMRKLGSYRCDFVATIFATVWARVEV